MVRPINGFNSTKVQIESSKTDVAVPNGIAISNGIYDKPLSYDLPPTTTVPMQMNKSGNQSCANKTWVDVTGFVADGAFPGTVIVNNSLVVSEAQRANISVWLKFNKQSGMIAEHIAQGRILVNGEVVRETTKESINFTGQVFSMGHTMDLKPGDSIRVQVWTNFFTLNFSTLQYIFYAGTLLATGSYVGFSRAKPGAVDFHNDLAFANDSKTVETGGAVYVMPEGLKKTLPIYKVTQSNNFITTYNAATIGPIIAQSKTPYPVEEGMLVNFGGTFYVRRTGTAEKTEDDAYTGMKVRFALWGHGEKGNEYGGEDVDVELMFYEAELQPSGNLTRTMMTYTIPAMTDFVIPADITQVYFAASLKQSVSDEYASGTFDNYERGGLQARYFGTSLTDPFYVKIEQPTAENNTYRHPLSTTGVAFKNRTYFDNMTLPKALTFFGNDSSVALNIYKSTNHVRGALIGTFNAAAGERKTVVIESDTGQIELASSNAYWVERCAPIEYDSLNETQTSLDLVQWQDISDPLSGIIATREEYAIGKMQLKFVSDELGNGDLLVPGKRVRMLINHYGNNRLPADGYADLACPR
ncbi:hypothetical protein [Rhodococcus sovatensis]|uniref:Uncharacterized protein n=1 Tax=Rhodococcus sovatensis TaxID=1805840 RepID=A0ABZ2PNI7_9NOCA